VDFGREIEDALDCVGRKGLACQGVDVHFDVCRGFSVLEISFTSIVASVEMLLTVGVVILEYI
jgi:hypothetical protein